MATLNVLHRLSVFAISAYAPDSWNAVGITHATGDFMVLKPGCCTVYPRWQASVAADTFILVNEFYGNHWWMRLWRDTLCGEKPAVGIG